MTVRHLAVPAYAAVTVLLADDFTGTNGASWDTTKWPTRQDVNGGGGTITIQGNQGQTAGGGRPWAASALTVTDFELLVKVSAASLTTKFMEIAWRVVRSPPSQGYLMQTGFGNVHLFKNLTVYTSVAAAVSAASIAAAGSAWFRVRVVGSNHKIRWWLDGSAEPGTWPIDVTDTTYTSGSIALIGYGDTMLFDDLTVVAV